MISFELSEEQSITRSLANKFARDVLRPIAHEVDTAGQISANVLNQLWSLGAVDALIGDAGSSGASSGNAILNALIMEELGWGDAAFAVALAAPLGFARAIAEQGSVRQKAEILPLFSGVQYCGAAVAIAESGFLGGIHGVRSTAVADPNGYRLNGTKVQVPLASKCAYFLMLAKHDGKLDAFIVPADVPGVLISEPEGNLGLVPLRSATVTFDNVVVGPEMRLGENQGCDVQRIVDAGRIGASSILVGVCRGVYEHSVEYTKERVAHGSALARKQSVAFRLVDMFVEVEATRWMCWRAATHLDKRTTVTRSAALAQVYTNQQAAWITDEGVQLMGGHGFMCANPVERWYRNAKTLAMLEGVASV